MPIKKSFLEKKLFYRVAKVFFLILPILVILLLLNGKINVCDISQKSTLDILQNNIVYIAIGLTSYYLILMTVWRLFLYIVFGGLEDDTKKQEIDQSSVKTESKHEKPAQITPFIIAFIIFTIIALSLMGFIKLPKINLDNTNNNIDSNSGPTTCPTMSTQTATPCHSTQDGVGVGGVIVHDSCECPKDTTYSGTTDYVTPGGPYKICTCN